ncbi:MAG: lysine--tRNA ligase [Chloroflexi bacterium]|nr:lysine--tRNA ligase [Chloroflexota bacterium]
MLRGDVIEAAPESAANPGGRGVALLRPRLRSHVARRPGPGPRRHAYAGLFEQDRSLAHWALHYAQRVASAVPEDEPIVIQTSMSPSGRFHIGNFRDTVCAHLVQQALTRLGRRSSILLSFDDYDPVRASAARARDDLAGCEGMPLAAGARTREICRAYIAELKAMDICPRQADADGRGAAGWDTHYQAERYRTGRYVELQRDAIRNAKRIARLLGVAQPTSLFGAYCEQCGRDRTELLALHADRVRYLCRTCGAIVTTSDVRHLKPRWTLDWTLRVVHERISCEPAGQDHCSSGSTMDRTPPLLEQVYGRTQPVIVPYGLVRQFDATAKISGSRGGGLTLSDLLPLMPPPLILWLFARTNCKRDMRISLERSAIYAYYDGFDRFVVSAATSERARVLRELVGARRGAPPPPFRTLVALLQKHWYDPAAVERALGDIGPEVRVRLAHAHAWLATYGRRHAWIVAGQAPGSSCAHPPNARRMLEPGYLSEPRTRAEYAELYRTLFGTHCGPPLRRILATFGEARVSAAIEEFARDGHRPLRAQLLENLGGRST